MEALESPNIEDDRAVKFAITGYAYNRPAESWGREEFDSITPRRVEVADLGSRWVEFVCLATGYMLGLFQARLLTEHECLRFEALLPGFLWLHARQFTEAEPGAAADGGA